LWETVQTDAKTGRPIKRVWSKNVVTDQGAVNILTAAINNAVPAAVFNNILITNNSASTTLTSAIAVSQTGLTSISVAALPAALPNGTTLMLGYGTGTNQNVVVNNAGGYAQGYAGAVTVNSFNTDGSHSYAVGSAVVPVPQTTDNPSNANLTVNATTPLSSYSGNISSGGFSSGTGGGGAGNRFVTVTFVFKNSTNGGSTSNGRYSCRRLVA
jgi:hypothetical protein